MNRTYRLIAGLLLVSIISACSPTIIIKEEYSKVNNSQKSIETSDRQLHDIALNGKVYSALWQQNSAEFKALCYQAYNLATQIVTKKASMNHLRPIAIITDLDETVLDNSPYAVAQALKGEEYDSKTWTEWVNKVEATAYPGSVEFFNYAASKNVHIFYVSNRSDYNEKEATIANLKKLGFPFADEEHVLLKGDSSDKETRRQQILKDYEVFMYLGDNLIDFDEVFNDTTQEERNALVDQMSDYFGRSFIVLPNSGYGDWEGALPGYDFGGSVEEKDRAILNHVKGY